jgi:trehalose utilization protein
VADQVVDRVQRHVWEGMGLIVLHSGHFSKIFKRLMGTPCSLKWREAGELERIWVINRNHPIAAGLGEFVEVPETEMYGEPFLVPEPTETVFVTWYQGGEVFRSGLTYRRGAGKIFYFSPGHEVYPIYHQPQIQLILRNAVNWAHSAAPRWKKIDDAPNVPVDKAPEKIEARGPRLHAEGEAGLR